MSSSVNGYELIPASKFTVGQLTEIYNQARADYMIPMQMNPAGLAEYIKTYDIDLDHSLVASENGTFHGIAMLGVRADRTWITRLGVIPSARRSGVGEVLSRGLLEQSYSLGIKFTMLEVIKTNAPARRLFLKLGFYEVGELLILGRSLSRQPVKPVPADTRRLERSEALGLINLDRGTQPWTNQAESVRHAGEISGLYLTLADGSRGWLVYRREKLTLSHFIYKTEEGSPAEVAFALLSHLHHQYPRLDAQIENIRLNDPHLPAFYKMGYLESFRRIEMWCGTPRLHSL